MMKGITAVLVLALLLAVITAVFSLVNATGTKDELQDKTNNNSSVKQTQVYPLNGSYVFI